MKTLASINRIRDLKNSITEKLSSVTWKDSEFTCGSENEYNAKSLLGGLKGLMADVAVLTKAPAQFIKLSTHAERNSIIQILQRIEQHINQPNNLSNQVDELKIKLRPYCTRTRKEWFEEVGEYSDTLIKKQVELESSLQTAKAIIKEAESLRSELKESYNTFNLEKDEASKELDSKLQDLETLEGTQEKRSRSLMNK